LVLGKQTVKSLSLEWHIEDETNLLKIPPSTNSRGGGGGGAPLFLLKGSSRREGEKTMLSIQHKIRAFQINMLDAPLEGITVWFPSQWSPCSFTIEYGTMKRTFFELPDKHEISSCCDSSRWYISAAETMGFSCVVSSKTTAYHEIFLSDQEFLSTLVDKPSRKSNDCRRRGVKSSAVNHTR
jgi:hypothetical protein